MHTCIGNIAVVFLGFSIVCGVAIAQSPAQSFRLGNGGQPYQDQESGGCHCGRQSGWTRNPNGSVYWPLPRSANRQERSPCISEFAGNQIVPAIGAPFDRLSNFQGIVPYQRQDDGYYGGRLGFGQDRFGRIGQSREENGILDSYSGVVGLGIRVPSIPVQRDQ